MAVTQFAQAQKLMGGKTLGAPVLDTSGNNLTLNPNEAVTLLCLLVWIKAAHPSASEFALCHEYRLSRFS